MKQSATESGFSLLELLIVVGILTIVMGAAFQLMFRGQSIFDANEIRSEALANAAFATNRVTEIVRGAGANPDNDTVVASTRPFDWNATDSSVTLKADLNGDGDLEDDIGTEGYYQGVIIASENLTIRWVGVNTDINGTTVPANTLCMIDNVTSADHTPIVIATHILEFECEAIGGDLDHPDYGVLRLTAGPTRDIPLTSPHYQRVSRTTEFRLRNRF